MWKFLLVLFFMALWYIIYLYLPENISNILLVIGFMAFIRYYIDKIEKLEDKVKSLEEKCTNLWNREDNNMDFMMKNFRRLNKLEDKLGKQKKTTH